MLALSLRRAWRAGLNLLYPPGCIACEAATAEPYGLCGRCWAELSPIERPYCERLGTPFAVDYGQGLLSPQAIADPPVFARARAALRYEGAARALVHRLKYADRLDLAPALAVLMARAGAELLADAHVIVPVPLHRGRLWRRRFNQAMALSLALSRRTGLPCEPLLSRVKPTVSQVGLTRAQRRENLQGAFRVSQEAKPRLQGQRVLLVDDVLTTGSTANAAARALLRGGAAAVDVLTLAQVVTQDAGEPIS